MNSRKDKGPGEVHVRKTLVRNVEVSIPKSNKSVKEKSADKNNLKVKPKDNVKKYNSLPVMDLTKPELNSAKMIMMKVEKLENYDPKSNIIYSDAEMLAVNRKAGRKLNFHFDKNMYKDLEALNISKSSPSLKPTSRSSREKTSITKDVEPNLDDFYDDKKEIDKCIKISAVKVKLSPVIKYDATDLYRKFQSWEDN